MINVFYHSLPFRLAFDRVFLILLHNYMQCSNPPATPLLAKLAWSFNVPVKAAVCYEWTGGMGLIYLYRLHWSTSLAIIIGYYNI